VKPTRILHLTDRLSERGGAARHLLGVVTAQLEQGHAVAVAAEAITTAAPAGCATFTAPGLAARTRAPVALAEAVRAHAPDVIHLHTVVNPAALEWAAARGALITVQDHRYFCAARGKWTADGQVCAQPARREPCAGCFEDAAYFEAIWALTQERLRALHGLRVVVLSDYMRRELVASGLDAGRVHVVPPFVCGLDPCGGEAAAPCVLFAGRLTAGKGVAEAVDAWRLAGTGLPLVMAGTGPLREWAAAAGADVRGWLPHAALAPLYRGAAALLMPSRWQEPFGIVGLEALTLGTPVAAWRSGGIPEWHPGGPGLVSWGDVEGLAAALRALAGTRAVAPAGFGKEGLMQRLHGVYEQGLQ